MADLHKYTVQESLNASQGNAGTWTVNSAGTVDSTGGTTTTLSLGDDTCILLLQPTVETQISFTKRATNINATNDISIPANTLTAMVVPRGVADLTESTTVVLNYCGDTASSGTMRIVEV